MRSLEVAVRTIRLGLGIVVLASLLQLVGCAAPAAPAGASVTETPAPGDEQEQMSQQGLYRVRWLSDRGNVPLNTLHTWTLHVQDAGGGPVAGARILVDGAMPAHNHGLPTQPMVTADLGDGDYRLEGMQFQMPGAWVISVTVESAAGADVAVLPLNVAP